MNKSLKVAVPVDIAKTSDELRARLVSAISRANAKKLPDVFDIQTNMDSIGATLRQSRDGERFNGRLEDLLKAPEGQLSIYARDLVGLYYQHLAWVSAARVNFH